MRSANDKIKITADTAAVKKSLEGVSASVAARAAGTAVRKALAPVKSRVKMTIAQNMAGGVSKKGIRDYKRAIGTKVKVYKRGKKGGTAWGGVGARRGVGYASANHDHDTVWSKIAHLFEFGTSRGIPAYSPIEMAYRSEERGIEGNVQRAMLDSIRKAVNRNRKIKSMK